MKKLQCTVCGAALVMELGGEYAGCEHCGMRYRNDDIKRYVIEEKVTIDGAATVDSLLQYAGELLGATGNTYLSEAHNAYKRALEIDPKSAVAWEGLAMTTARHLPGEKAANAEYYYFADELSGKQYFRIGGFVIPVENAGFHETRVIGDVRPIDDTLRMTTGEEVIFSMDKAIMNCCDEDNTRIQELKSEFTVRAKESLEAMLPSLKANYGRADNAVIDAENRLEANRKRICKLERKIRFRERFRRPPFFLAIIFAAAGLFSIDNGRASSLSKVCIIGLSGYVLAALYQFFCIATRKSLLNSLERAKKKSKQLQEAIDTARRVVYDLSFWN